MRADTPEGPGRPGGQDISARTDDELAALYAWPDTPGPTVRANMITSLDGGAALDGRSGGLGNEADQRLFGVLRDLADVILVGSGTVRAEQYAGVELDDARRARRVRWGRPAAPPPIAVVTGRGIDADLPLFTSFETAPIVVTPRAAAGHVPDAATALLAGEEVVDLAAAIRGLADRGFRRIHCEGGPDLLGRVVGQDLLDECCLTIAPILLGSAATRLLPAELAAPARWTPVGLAVDGGFLFTRYHRDRR